MDFFGRGLPSQQFQGDNTKPPLRPRRLRICKFQVISCHELCIVGVAICNDRLILSGWRNHVAHVSVQSSAMSTLPFWCIVFGMVT